MEIELQIYKKWVLGTGKFISHIKPQSRSIQYVTTKKVESCIFLASLFFKEIKSRYFDHCGISVDVGSGIIVWVQKLEGLTRDEC